MIVDRDVEPSLAMPPIQLPQVSLEPNVVRDRVTLAGVPIDPLSFDDAVRAIVLRAQQSGESAYVVTPNSQHVVLYQSDALLREIYQKAFVVATDGVPLLWAAKLLGDHLPGRVNGTDLFEALCAEAAMHGLRVYLLGGRPGAAKAAAAVLGERHPMLDICGIYCPKYGFEWDPSEQANIVRDIKECRPHLIFVGLGAPKQEYWMYNNRHSVNAMMLGIGVSFEFVGGIVQRAPRWMQCAGLEWFFRLLLEPGRLWKRYLIGNALFCALIARQYVATRFARAEPATLAGESAV